MKIFVFPIMQKMESDAFVKVGLGCVKQREALSKTTIRKCLAEIRDMGDTLGTWRKLHNGMTVGDFSCMYVVEYRDHKNARPH